MAAHPGPVAVTLVSGDTDDLDWLTNEVDIHEWQVIDLRERLPMDPSSVDPTMLDYTDEWVITTVVGLNDFPFVVEYIIESAVAAWTGDVKMFVLGGELLASVTSACVESQLNSLVHTYTQAAQGYSPVRIFNCKWFSFKMCPDTQTWHKQMDNICDWIETGGWELADAICTERAMFGYDAAKKSMSSSRNWKSLGFAIDTYHLRIWHECAWEPHDEESKSWGGKSKSSDANWQDRTREIEVPDWVTFNQDATVWRSYLEKMNVDEPAQQSLFLLAQSSPENYWEANSIISKLIKKVVDGRELRNPSGFVFSSVLNVRNKGDNVH